MKRKTLKIEPKLSVHLRSVGNPDHRQYAPISEPRTVLVDTLEEAREECMKYITEWDLGGGNWPHTHVVSPSGQKIARISYNGRVWDNADQEIKLIETSQPQLTS